MRFWVDEIMNRRWGEREKRRDGVMDKWSDGVVEMMRKKQEAGSKRPGTKGQKLEGRSKGQKPRAKSQKLEVRTKKK